MSRLTVFRSHAAVLPTGVERATVHVRRGVIERVSAWPDVPEGADLVDTGSAALLPGVVDTHVHINDPGRTRWEGFDTATRAAALGGVTTLVDMPLNCDPPTTTLRALEAKLAAASDQLMVDVGLWGGVIPGNLAQLRPLHDAGVLGFKAFMCASGIDDFPPVSVDDLRVALEVLAPLDTPLLVHAEWPAALRAPAAGADPARYATWLATRPPEAEITAITTLIDLARETGARIHVVHLATPFALDLLADARQRGVRITVETCPHYLHFCAADAGDGHTEFKCAPPIRQAEDRDGLWAGLERGVIDLIATDHSPCLPQMKHAESGDFLSAWGGIASLQLSLAIVWSGARRRGVGLADVCRWMCEGPARLAGVARKGAIRAGGDADLVVFDPDAEWVVDARRLAHRHPVTPYAGARLTGQVVATYLRGEPVAAGGQITADRAGRVLRHRTTTAPA